MLGMNRMTVNGFTNDKERLAGNMDLAQTILNSITIIDNIVRAEDMHDANLADQTPDDTEDETYEEPTLF